MNVVLCGESEPDGSLGDGGFGISEEVLLSVRGRGGGGLLDVGNKRLAGLEGLVRVDRDRGLGRLGDSSGGRHCEVMIWTAARRLSSVVAIQVGFCLLRRR